MNPADSPPPSWYAPPADGPESWPVTCRTCGDQMTFTGEQILCGCGDVMTITEANRQYPAKEERE